VKKQIDMRARLKADAGRGVSTKLVDTAFWLPDIDDPVIRPWYLALDAIGKAVDNVDDKAQAKARAELAELLRGPIPERARQLLADLITCYQFTRPKGPPRIPAYQRSTKQLELEWAYEEMRKYIAKAKAKGKLAKQVIDDAIATPCARIQKSNQKA
jgi:hypothetical protein